MIWHRLLIIACLFGMAVASTHGNGCYLEVIRHNDGKADCECFLAKTATLPASTSTVTVTARPVTVTHPETRIVYTTTTETPRIIATTTTYTSIIPTTLIQEGVTSHTVFTTDTLTSYLSTTLVTVYSSASAGERNRAASRRSLLAACGGIPAYASNNCLDSAQYSLACRRASGAAIGATTVVALPPAIVTVQTTITPTVTDRVFITVTNTATATVTGAAASTGVSTQLVGWVSFVSTSTFWITLDTTATTDIATVTGGTLTKTTVVPTR